MSNRPGPLSGDEQVMVGAIVAAQRAAGWCWKRIARWHRMSRVQLWRCLMKHKTDGMKHHEGCDRSRAA